MDTLSVAATIKSGLFHIDKLHFSGALEIHYYQRQHLQQHTSLTPSASEMDRCIMFLVLFLASTLVITRGEDDTSLVERVVRLEATTREQNSKIEMLTRTNHNLSSQLTAMRSCTERRVAFTAALTGPGGYARDGQTVVYNKVIYNLGNAYSPATGTFTCPVAGVYGFMVNVRKSNAGKFACLWLRRGRDYVNWAWDVDTVYRDFASTSATLQLDVGDTVAVHSCLGVGYMYTDPAPSNTFSGVLISADTCV